MTTTTAMNWGLLNTPSPPSWVNLDALVPPEMRAEAKALTEHINTYGPSRGDANRVEEIFNAISDATTGKDIPDGFIGDVMLWSGYVALEDACRREGIVLPDE